MDRLIKAHLRYGGYMLDLMPKLMKHPESQQYQMAAWIAGECLEDEWNRYWNSYGIPSETVCVSSICKQMKNEPSVALNWLGK